MKVYLLSQNENDNYDTYNAMVVCAEDEEQARHITPDDLDFNTYTTRTHWCSSPDKVTVTHIGEASSYYKEPTIVLASFNAS